MLKYLTDHGCIDMQRLLLLRAKAIGLTDEDAHILMIMMLLMEEGDLYVTPQKIAAYTSAPVSAIDKALLRLAGAHFVDRAHGRLDLTPLYRKLLDAPEEDVKEEVNLAVRFEQEFGRPLTPIEVNIIDDFKRAGYDDETILDALAEASKSNVRNMRYVEKVLSNWRQNGRKITRGVPEDKAPDVPEDVRNFKWWEES